MILAERAGITDKPGLSSLEPLTNLTCCDPLNLNEYLISQVCLPFVSQMGHNLNWRSSNAQKNQEPAHGLAVLTRAFQLGGQPVFFSAGFDTNIYANSF